MVLAFAALFVQVSKPKQHSMLLDRASEVEHCMAGPRCRGRAGASLHPVKKICERQSTPVMQPTPKPHNSHGQALSTHALSRQPEQGRSGGVAAHAVPVPVSVACAVLQA